MTNESASAPLYRAVPAMLDLPAMEREILGFWAANDTFAASLERTKAGRPWTFYEGPPTANGMPGMPGCGPAPGPFPGGPPPRPCLPMLFGLPCTTNPLLSLIAPCLALLSARLLFL